MVKVKVDLNGVKIPKTVAGMKVPKKLRKQGKKLLAQVQSPAGQEALATGLSIAGAALAAAMQAKAAKRARADGAPASAATGQSGEAAPRAAGADRTPGMAGIDAKLELGDAVMAGMTALQRVLAGMKAG